MKWPLENSVSIKTGCVYCVVAKWVGMQNVLLLYCGSQKKIERQCLGTVGMGNRGYRGQDQGGMHPRFGIQPPLIAEALYVVGWWGSMVQTLVELLAQPWVWGALLSD